EMPCEPSLTNVDVHHDDLVDLLGQRLSLEECVDRITFMGAGPESVQGDVMTFDIFPNRPDLYSVEGIARGLRGFLGLEVGLPSYRVEPSGIEFVVDPSVADVRPYAVGGVVRGIELDDALLRSLVDLQEKLHLTAGRRRRKVAIGIHDLDKVTPPYRYQAVRPHEVRFTPLGLAEELDLAEILAKHDKGREYAPLVASKPRFPIIRDAHGQVLSFPPVINGIVTQLTPDTQNLFLDVTGTDLEAVQGCLAILATALAERGGRIQTVRTTYSDRTLETPDLSPATHSLNLSRANAWLGLSLTPAQAVEGLRPMRHDARPAGRTLSVLSPPCRRGTSGASRPPRSITKPRSRKRSRSSSACCGTSGGRRKSKPWTTGISSPAGPPPSSSTGTPSVGSAKSIRGSSRRTRLCSRPSRSSSTWSLSEGTNSSVPSPRPGRGYLSRFSRTRLSQSTLCGGSADLPTNRCQMNQVLRRRRSLRSSRRIGARTAAES